MKYPSGIRRIELEDGRIKWRVRVNSKYGFKRQCRFDKYDDAVEYRNKAVKDRNLHTTKCIQQRKPRAVYMDPVEQKGPKGWGFA